MKKLKYVIFLLIITLCLSSCTSEGLKNTLSKPSIVVTNFPAYDWIGNILGEESENFEISYLAKSGVDMHSYQPSIDDIARISDCDLLIYIGGESENWIGNIIANKTNPNMQTISLCGVLKDNIKQEEIIEGMQADNDNPEIDEHVWLSLKNAVVFTDKITSALCGIAPEKTDIFESNNADYQVKLNVLDSKYRKVIDSAQNKTLIFCDRFPFRYLCDDYGLNYFAAFPGCSSEVNASFQTITFLSQKLSELNLSNVLVLTDSDEKIANSVISGTNKACDILHVDSMQSVDDAKIESGYSYLDVMAQNLQIIDTALN